MCASTNLKWHEALPLVLMTMRNTPDRKTGLSPHEILMCRAMRLSVVPANALVSITDDMVLDYCKGLADVVRSFSQQGWKKKKEELRPDLRSIEDSSITPVRDEGGDLQEGDCEPISIEAPGEPRRRKAFLEADSFERQTEQFTDPEGEGVEADQSHCDMTPPEPLAGPSRENTTEQGEVESSTLIRTLTKGPLKGDKWPESQAKRKEAVVEITIEEEVDTTRREDLSEGESNGD
ncbi:hypothetical protein NDU88_006190 [Pleurodeles waltl]|uniref:Uncharacterized protein n=1 Tax=Pleurodeles waltl TaxID=8319 RepID=A0AAV7SNX0_PLEWA|nr:hypothetical protein NDU88_006190 [Pleurodeles waltl]